MHKFYLFHRGFFKKFWGPRPFLPSPNSTIAWVALTCKIQIAQNKYFPYNIYEWNLKQTRAYIRLITCKIWNFINYAWSFFFLFSFFIHVIWLYCDIIATFGQNYFIIIMVNWKYWNKTIIPYMWTRMV